MDKKEQLLQKLKEQGFSDAIVSAFKEVERRSFVLPAYHRHAYDDTALSIGHEQTISQPSTIAFMLSLLDPRSGSRILEVGSGSGYVLALLAVLAPEAEIIGTERIYKLVERSRGTLYGRKNIRIEYTPLELGFKEKQPFDRILVSASASRLPQELVDQLASGGIMVCPVGQSIVRARKTSHGLQTEKYRGFVFVRLYEDMAGPRAGGGS